MKALFWAQAVSYKYYSALTITCIMLGAAGLYFLDGVLPFQPNGLAVLLPLVLLELYALSVFFHELDTKRTVYQTVKDCLYHILWLILLYGIGKVLG